MAEIKSWTDFLMKSDVDDSIKFYALIGHLMTRWACIDNILFDIFHAAIGSDKKSSSILFYHGVSIAQRFDLVSDILKSKNNEIINENLNYIKQIFVENSKFRNIVAHSEMRYEADIEIIIQEDNTAKLTVLKGTHAKLFTPNNEMLRGKKVIKSVR